MTIIVKQIQEHIDTVHSRMATACEKASRPAQDVTLLAVSKTFGACDVLSAAGLGLREFGENYVQEAVAKIDEVNSLVPDLGLIWHCIGNVQSNKAKIAARYFDWVHSADSEKLLLRLSKFRAEFQNEVQNEIASVPDLNICIQVNIDGGANKSGISPDEVFHLCEFARGLPAICLRGLMFIPEPADFAGQLEIFSKCRDLFNSVNSKFAGQKMDTLSMGMSDDLEAAILCGSSMVRVGRAIFGNR